MRAKPTAKPKRAALTPEQRAAQGLLKSMSLRDRVAQLVIGVAYGDVPSRKSPEYEKFRHWVRDLQIGGLIVNNRVQYGTGSQCRAARVRAVSESDAEDGEDSADCRRGFRARGVDARH